MAKKQSSGEPALGGASEAILWKLEAKIRRRARKLLRTSTAGCVYASAELQRAAGEVTKTITELKKLRRT